MTKFLFFLLFFLQLAIISATCVSTGSGDWANPATWSCNGVPSVPLCGDTIITQAGHTVTITSQQDYVKSCCGTSVFIVIATSENSIYSKKLIIE